VCIYIFQRYIKVRYFGGATIDIEGS